MPIERTTAPTTFCASFSTTFSSSFSAKTTTTSAPSAATAVALNWQLQKHTIRHGRDRSQQHEQHKYQKQRDTRQRTSTHTSSAFPRCRQAQALRCSGFPSGQTCLHHPERSTSRLLKRGLPWAFESLERQQAGVPEECPWRVQESD